MKRKFILAGAAILILAWGAAVILDWRPEQPPDRPPADASPEFGEAEAPAPPAATEAQTIRGAVVDIEDRPLPGARVQLVRRRRYEPDYEVLAETIADSAGAFRTVRPGTKEHEDDYFFFEAEVEGFAKATRHLREGEDDVHIVLLKSHPLTVTVVGERGEPIPSARVYVARTGMDPWSVIEHTGPEGRARFAVPPGLLSIYVSSSGLVAKKEGLKEDRQKVEIRLRRTSDLRGLTVEEGSGNPVGGVTVRMGKTEVTTDTDGRFLLTGISPGDRLSFSSAWHISRTVQISNVPADEVFERKFTLTPAGRISGVVLTADGRPAAGAWIHTDWRIAGLAYRPGRKASGAVVLAGSDGKFSLDAVKPGEDFRVFAALSGSTAGVSWPLRLHAREALSEVVIRLGPPSAAEVEVIAEDGTAIKEVSVEFRCMKGDPWAPLDGRSRANIFNFYRGPAKLTLEGLTGRAFKLYIHAEGYQPVMLPSTLVVPAAGLPVRKVRVILPRGLSISGFLLTASGRPVRGAVIHVNRGREHLRKAIPFSCLHAYTDEQGRFQLFGLEDTDYSIHALSSQGRTEVLEGVAAGSENIELRLK